MAITDKTHAFAIVSFKSYLGNDLLTIMWAETCSVSFK